MAQHARTTDTTTSNASSCVTQKASSNDALRGKHAALHTSEQSEIFDIKSKLTPKLIKNTAVKAFTYIGVVVVVGIVGTSITLALDDPLNAYDFDTTIQASAQSGTTNKPETPNSTAASEENDAPESLDDSATLKLPQTKGYTLTANDLTSLSSDREPFAFAFATNEASEATLDSDEYDTIAQAVSNINDLGGDASYILVDIAEGRGIAGNLDYRVYGASSIKGPLALYYCQNQLETNLMNGDTLIDESSALFDMDGTYVTDGIPAYPVGTLISDSIITSDNDSFRILRAYAGDDEWEAWLASLGITEIDKQQWFPTYSARESALMWLNGATYLADPSAYYAPWLSQQFEQTEVSYIRTGLANEDVTIMNKAGWIADSDPAFSATCDAGLITDQNGRVYLMSIMTSAPDCEESEAAVAQLAKALWDAHASN